MCKGSVVCEGEKEIVEFDDDDEEEEKDDGDNGGDDDEESMVYAQRLQGSLVSDKAGAIGRSSSKTVMKYYKQTLLHKHYW